MTLVALPLHSEIDKALPFRGQRSRGLPGLPRLRKPAVLPRATPGVPDADKAIEAFRRRRGPKIGEAFTAGPGGVEPPKPRGVKGFLHPSNDPSSNILGASTLTARQEAGRRKAMARLSVPDEPISTVGRFARAARGSKTELSATVHPLSGRIMAMERGDKNNTPLPAPPVSRARQRARELYMRSSNPEVERRAAALADRGTGTGPRPIFVHSHPKTVGRQMPSGQDLVGGNMQLDIPGIGQRRGQNVVVTPRRQGARRGGKNTSAVWSGVRPDVDPKVPIGRLASRMSGLERTGGNKRLSRAIQGATFRDIATQTGPQLDAMNAPEAHRKQVRAARRVRRVGVATSLAPSMDYDESVARATSNPKSAFYTRQTYLKRDKDHRGATALQAAGAGGVGLAAGANRIADTAQRAKLRPYDKELAYLRSLDAATRTKRDLRPTGNRRTAEELGLGRGRNATQAAARRDHPEAKRRVVRRQPPKPAPGSRSDKQAARRQLARFADNVRSARRQAAKTPAIGRKGVERMTAGGLAFGIPALAIGTRSKYEPASKRERTREEVDRMIGGAAAGAGAHQGVVYGTKPIDRRLNAKIAADEELQRAWNAHRAKHGNPGVGDPRNKAMFRDYPEQLPGARYKRVMAHVGAGKTGLAVTAASAAGGAKATDELFKAMRPHPMWVGIDGSTLAPIKDKGVGLVHREKAGLKPRATLRGRTKLEVLPTNLPYGRVHSSQTMRRIGGVTKADDSRLVGKALQTGRRQDYGNRALVTTTGHGRRSA